MFTRPAGTEVISTEGACATTSVTMLFCGTRPGAGSVRMTVPGVLSDSSSRGTGVSPSSTTRAIASSSVRPMMSAGSSTMPVET